MNPIGTLIEYLVNPDNMFYSYGYLVCDIDDKYLIMLNNSLIIKENI